MRTLLIAMVVAWILSLPVSAQEPKGPADAPRPPETRPVTAPATTTPAEPPVEPAPKEKPVQAVKDPAPRVMLETTLGAITLELDATKSPVTVANFLRYVEDGYYVGTTFHRVIPTFMIQGGGYTPDLSEKAGGLHEPIALEAKNGLKNLRGTVAMARTSNPNSATSQFFINVTDNAMLDYPQPDGNGYAVFGKVVEGMNVVDKIRDTPTKSDAKYPGGPVVPVTPVVITAAHVVKGAEAGTKPVVAPPPPPPPPKPATAPAVPPEPKVEPKPATAPAVPPPPPEEKQE